MFVLNALYFLVCAGENFKVSSFVSETKRSTEELAEWLKDIVGPSWQNVCFTITRSCHHSFE